MDDQKNQDESEAKSKELEENEPKESNDGTPQNFAKEESVVPSVTLKQCFISLEKLKMSDSESTFDSDEDLPPLFTMTTRSSKPKSQKSAKERMEEQESLAKGIKMDDISIDNIKETMRRLEFVPSPEMDDTSLSEEPETNEEKSISIFCSNSHLQYFHISDVSFLQCGYDSTSEKLTVFEKEMLSFSRVELEHVLSSFLLISNINCISDYKSFVTFLLRNISAHNDIACVEACYNVLSVLLEKHPDVKSLNFSNSEIFMLLFNYGTEIDDFKFLSRKPDFLQCLREESAKKNKSHSDIPENWMFNFKFIMIAITSLINNCQFEVKELCNIIIYFLWMSLDSALLQENLFSTVRECIVVSLDQIPSDKWPRVLREVAWTFVTMPFPSKKQKWNNIYHIAQSMPITSERGAELRKYIAFLALTALGKERISAKESKTLNGFSLGELQSLLQKIVQMNSDLTSSFAAKFLNLCISRLKTNDDDFMELCSILKYVESALTEECHEAKSRFMKIHARLKIPYGKNSAYKLLAEDKKKWSFAIKQETDQEAVGQKASDEATIQPIHLVKVKQEPDSGEQCADKIISFIEFDCENEDDDDDLDFDYFDKLSETSSAVPSVKVKNETTSDSESSNVEGNVPFSSNMPNSSLDSLVLPMDISSNVCEASTVCDSELNIAESPTENIPIIGNVESLNANSNIQMSLEVNRNTSIDVCNECVNNELNIVEDSRESQEKNVSGLTVGAGFDDESPKEGASVIIKSEIKELEEPEKEESFMDIPVNGPVISVADTLLFADEPESVVFTKESKCPEVNMPDSKNKEEILIVLPEKNLGEGSSQLHQSNESNASATDDLSSVNNSDVHVNQSVTVDDSSTKEDETLSDFYKSLGLPPGTEISPVKTNIESTVGNDLSGPSSDEIEISSDTEVEIIDEKIKPGKIKRSKNKKDSDPEIEVLLVTPPKSKSNTKSGILEDSFNKLEQREDDKDEEIMIVTELKNEADKTKSSVIISTPSGSKDQDIDNRMTVIHKEDSVHEPDSASEIKPFSSVDENLVKIGDETLQIGSKNSLLEKAVEFYCKDICDMSRNKDNMAASSTGTSVSAESKQILEEFFESHPESFVSNDSKIMDEVSAVMNEAIDVVKDLKSAALAEQSPEFSSSSVLATVRNNAIVNKDEVFSNIMSKQNSVGKELLLENVKEKLDSEKVCNETDTEKHASTLSGEFSKNKVTSSFKRKLSFSERRSICDNVENESSLIDHSNDENGPRSEISRLLDDLLKSPVLLTGKNEDISELSKSTNSSQNIPSSISPLSSLEVNQDFSCNTHQPSNNCNLETIESVQNVSSLKKRTRNENDPLQSSVLDYFSRQFSPAKKVSLRSETKSPVLHSVSKSNSRSPVKRKNEFSSPSSKVPKHSASVVNENSIGRHSHHTKSNKNKSSKSPSKHSPRKSSLSTKVLSSKKSPAKFFDYKQKRINYVKSPRKKLLSKKGLHLINVLQEKLPTSTSNQQRSTKISNTDIFVLSDSDSDVVELYCDPKRYKDKECMVIYESEDVVVLDSD